MDIDKVVALLRCIENKSITKAAEELLYTTSGLSRMITSLEDELGIKLLIREKKGVSPTRECISLLPLMNDLANVDKRFKQKINEIRGIDTGEIHIGTAYVIYYRSISNLISKFVDIYPNIKVIIYEGTSSELAKKIDDRELDMAIISNREGKFDWHKIVSDNLLVMLPENHEYAKIGKFPIKNFEKESYIEIYTGRETDNSRFFNINGITPNIKFSTNDSFSACKMVEAGLGISLVNRLISKSLSARVSYAQPEKPYIVDIGLAYQPIETLSHVAKIFLNFIKENIDEIVDY